MSENKKNFGILFIGREFAQPGVLNGFGFDSPTLNTKLTSPLLRISGWVLGCQSSVDRVEFVKKNEVFKSTTLNIEKPDVFNSYKHAMTNLKCGFEQYLHINEIRKGCEFVAIIIQAVLKDGMIVKLGSISIDEPPENIPLNCATDIIVHIEKTAGTTLRYVVNREYQEDERFFLYDTMKSTFSNLVERSLEEKLRLRLLMGHISIGQNVNQYVAQPCVYATFLRDPVCRVVSHYYHVKHIKNVQLEIENYDIQDFFKDFPVFTKNYYCYVLSGMYEYQNPEDRLSLAIKRLENNFKVIGLTERFDESILLFKRLLRWRSLPVYKKQNVRKETHKKIDFPDIVVYTIHEMNQLDIKLYQYAVELFERLILSQGESFQQELVDFKKQNETHQSYVSSK